MLSNIYVFGIAAAFPDVHEDKSLQKLNFIRNNLGLKVIEILFLSQKLNFKY